jgi:hypothetical protein
MYNPSQQNSVTVNNKSRPIKNKTVVVDNKPFLCQKRISRLSLDSNDHQYDQQQQYKPLLNQQTV